VVERKPKVIELLKKAIDEEIPALRLLRYGNPSYYLWKDNIRNIFELAFGQNSPEYTNFVWSGVRFETLLTEQDHQNYYIERLNHNELSLRKIVQKYALEKSMTEPIKGQIQAPVNSTQMANFLFDKMQFHPRIVSVSKSRFTSGQYSDAIFAAFKGVNNYVKKKSKLTADGKGLMTTVFSRNNSIIKLNKGISESEKNEQEGFMHIYEGAMLGIRNPKAHEEVAELDAYKTLEYLGLASLLMRRADVGVLEQTWKKQSKSKQP